MKPKIVAGIDEAGRGSLFGPLVIAGVSICQDKIRILREIGVKDSKLLSEPRRFTLYPEILKICEKIVSVSIQPLEIDDTISTREINLNTLEAEKMGYIISYLKPEIVYVDASDVNEKRFGKEVKRRTDHKAKVVARHHLDITNPVVSAASIVAKVERDFYISRMRNKIGDFGSGYPSDPKTRVFVIEALRSGSKLEGYIRSSWRTVKKLSKFVS